MVSSFEIGNIKIGINEEPLVIPEMGINHEGSLEVAKLIVDAACRAGAKIVKHQTHVVDDEMSHLARNVIPGNTDVSIFDVMKRCALNEEEEYELKKYAESKGMIFISTPFSRAAADRLERFGVLAYKIGSGAHYLSTTGTDVTTDNAALWTLGNTVGSNGGNGTISMRIPMRIIWSCMVKLTCFLHQTMKVTNNFELFVEF